MDPKKKLEDIHQASLEKIDDYLKMKGKIPPEHDEKISAAKKEWQASWNKFLELLMVLEKLEI